MSMDKDDADDSNVSDDSDDPDEDEWGNPGEYWFYLAMLLEAVEGDGFNTCYRELKTAVHSRQDAAAALGILQNVDAWHWRFYPHVFLFAHAIGSGEHCFMDVLRGFMYCPLQGGAQFHYRKNRHGRWDPYISWPDTNEHLALGGCHPAVRRAGAPLMAEESRWSLGRAKWLADVARAYRL